LKNDLQKKHKINFPAFEIAHAIYWKKANPESTLRACLKIQTISTIG